MSKPKTRLVRVPSGDLLSRRLPSGEPDRAFASGYDEAVRMRLPAVLAALVTLAGCAAAPAVGRGGRVYDVMVKSVDGRPTAQHGLAGHSCSIQVGNVVRQVWFAHDAGEPFDAANLTPLLRADEAALREGVSVEYVSWPWVTFHRVTAEELAAGAAVFYVPGPTGPHDVELWFRETRELAQTARPTR